MSTGQLTPDQSTMDVHLQTNPQLHFRVNGGANSRSSEDEALGFLSQEEQECLQFFEETIDSLEESLNEEERSLQETDQTDGPPSCPADSSSIPGSSTASSPGPSFLPPPMADIHTPKDQDIIDLVQPDLVQTKITKEPVFDPTMPDFQNMVRNPESHFEVRPKRDPTDTLPSEYNPPLPNSGYGGPADNLAYHPPGCIPTPVLIAQKIAENQGGGPANAHPSVLLRRRSLDSDMPSSYMNHPSRQGPPTSTKPSRFPSNISVMLGGGGKDSHNQSLASVNLHERRAQMLANLTGTSHPLEGHVVSPPPEKGRNVPTRSVSFRDPTPDKSRMEALSKLGLTRNRAKSGGSSDSTAVTSPTSTTNAGSSLNDPPVPAIPSTTPPPTAIPPTIPLSQTRAETRPEMVLPPAPDPFNNPDDKPIKVNPSPPATVTPSTYHPPPVETEAAYPPPPPEVASLDFNPYGGKSIVVNNSASNQSESSSSSVTAGGHDGKAHPSVAATPSDYNSYGGKSKVMTPVPAPITRSDLPDILSSHIDKSRVPPSPTTSPTTLPYELNSYGGKTRSITVTPSRGGSSSFSGTSHSLPRTPKAPAPSPAPKPSRASFHLGPLGPQKPPATAGGRPPSPEPRRRSISKPAAFRSQGITVQFSGRGATDESRREALRKLGLLKDTC